MWVGVAGLVFCVVVVVAVVIHLIRRVLCVWFWCLSRNSLSLCALCAVFARVPLPLRTTPPPDTCRPACRRCSSGDGQLLQCRRRRGPPPSLACTCHRTEVVVVVVVVDVAYVYGGQRNQRGGLAENERRMEGGRGGFWVWFLF